MLKLKFLLFGAIIGLFALQSCQTDETIVPETPNAEESVALRITLNKIKEVNNLDTKSTQATDSVVVPCFEFVYPIDLEYNTGASVTVNNDEELIQILMEETPNMYIIGIVMPFDVLLTDGNVQTIETEDDFFNLLESCDEYDVPNDDTFSGDCFEFSYPIQTITLDGTVYTIESDEAFEAFVQEHWDDWFFEFVYPLTLTLEDGSEVVVENEYEFFMTIEDCFGCNCDLIYDPVCVAVQGDVVIEFPNACEAECAGYTEEDFVDCDTIIPIDDCVFSNVEVEVGACSGNESYELVLNFTVEDNTSEEFSLYNFFNYSYLGTYNTTDLPLTLDFPYSGSPQDELLISFDGNDFCETGIAWEAPDCGEPETSDNFMEYVGICFDFVYPMQATVGEETIEIVTPNDLYMYFTNPIFNAELVYPVQIVAVASGDEYTINNQEELEEYIEENCNG